MFCLSKYANILDMTTNASHTPHTKWLHLRWVIRYGHNHHNPTQFQINWIKYVWLSGPDLTHPDSFLDFLTDCYMKERIDYLTASMMANLANRGLAMTNCVKPHTDSWPWYNLP